MPPLAAVYVACCQQASRFSLEHHTHRLGCSAYSGCQLYEASRVLFYSFLQAVSSSYDTLCSALVVQLRLAIEAWRFAMSYCVRWFHHARPVCIFLPLRSFCKARRHDALAVLLSGPPPTPSIDSPASTGPASPSRHSRPKVLKVTYSRRFGSSLNADA